MKEIDIRKKIAETDEILHSTYGEPGIKTKDRLSVLDEMILTILSQNTNDKNSMRAFKQLKKRFPSMQELSAAKQAEISEAIKIGGLSNIKAGYILGLLKWLEDTRGSLECSFICEMKTDEVIELFRPVKGIGTKTVAVTLAFACQRDVFPIDTHVFRVLKRLGILPGIDSPEKAYFFIQNLIPKGRGIPMHINVIKHGREICSARKPHCPICQLKSICSYFEDINTSTEKTGF
jgi:endonuclease-3